jgi:hypothetical protein
MKKIDPSKTGFYAMRKRLENMDPVGWKAKTYSTEAATKTALVSNVNELIDRVKALESGGVAPFPG